MKIYEFEIVPLSGFGTPLVGDTLFGHLCWQFCYYPELAGRTLEDLLSDYSRSPFTVISSACPRIDSGGSVLYAFPRPEMPLSLLFDKAYGDPIELIKKRKELKKRRWMLLDDKFLADGFHESLFVEDAKLFEHSTLKSTAGKYAVSFSQPRNKINRFTGTTGEGGFSPYSVEQEVYAPGAMLSVFAGIDTQKVSVEAVAEGLRRIGSTGYGRDASTGLGRFKVTGYHELDFGRPAGANACYTLSPSLPGEIDWRDIFFSPVIRYGRHGGGLAGSQNPFKAPVRMADNAAVYVTDGDIPELPYIGAAVADVSLAEPRSVVQGYSLYIPFRLEVTV
jgi:CRISPR-associated protein Csm4